MAAIAARVFPAYKPFVASVVEMFDQHSDSFPSGPYPADALRYRNDSFVEYRTPPHSDGLETEARFDKNDAAIEGVAMLAGPRSAPDLLFLAIRLPADGHRLVPAIIAQLERDAASLAPN